MARDIDPHRWVYVVVRKTGPQEQIVGQHDREYNVSFIPAFWEKESAMQGMLNMAREKKHKYEIQAIIFEDLERYSAQNGFMIFLLDSEGRVDRKIAPTRSSPEN